MNLSPYAPMAPPMNQGDGEKCMAAGTGRSQQTTKGLGRPIPPDSKRPHGRDHGSTAPAGSGRDLGATRHHRGPRGRRGGVGGQHPPAGREIWRATAQAPRLESEPHYDPDVPAGGRLPRAEGRLARDRTGRGRG